MQNAPNEKKGNMKFSCGLNGQYIIVMEEYMYGDIVRGFQCVLTNGLASATIGHSQ